MDSRSSSAPRTRTRAAALLSLMLAVASLAAQQPALPDGPGEAAIERARQRIRALQKEADALATQEASVLGELRKLEVERQLRIEELNGIEGEQRAARRQLADIDARATELQRRIEAERPEIEERLVHLYKMGSGGYWRLLLEVDDLRAIGRAYRTAAALARLDRERVEAHARTVGELQAEREALQARVRELAELERQAIRARAALERAVSQRTALVTAIDQRRDLNVQMIGELQAAQQRLQESLARLEGPAPATLPLRPFEGVLPWPAQGFVTRRFGAAQPGRDQDPAVRNGVELSLAEGQPVRAVHDGNVVYAAPFTGYGNLVILDHGHQTFSVYGHLREIEVVRGDRVPAEATVGLSGRNPAGNPSLYFELRVDGKPVDPLQWLTKR